MLRYNYHTVLAVILALSANCAAGSAGAQTPAKNDSAVVIKSARPKAPDAAAAPPPLELYTQYPRVETAAVSPDGSHIAWITRKEGLRLLVTYKVADGSNQGIRLSDDPVSALTWLDNNHIVLSDTETGQRGTCPGGAGHAFKTAQSVSDLDAAMSISGFSGGSSTSVSAPDPILAQILASELTPPKCVAWGVRANEAATIIDLRTRKSVTLGKRMTGDYNHMPLGLPKPIVRDGKLLLIGPFLELRDKSIGGTLAQRAYLWSVDPDTGRGRIIDDKGGDLDREGSYVDDWLTDETGQPVVRALYTYDTATFSIEMRKDNRWSTVLKRKIDTKANTFAPFLAGRGRDGVTLLLVDRDAERRFRYYELAADGTVSEPLNADATHDRPVFDPETGALEGFAHDGEITTYTFFDEGLAQYFKHAVDTFPGQAVRIVDLARDPGKMIVFEQGGSDTGSWHYFDFVDGKRIDIGSQYPTLPVEWLASQRPITYAAADGLPITAQLTLPPQGEAKNRALVVLPHDGPLGHERRAFDWLAQALASRGYVVLQPNYRGSDGGTAALTEAGYGQWSGKMLSDLSDGVRYLAKQGIIDTKRVCIAGQGYGGYAALNGAQSKGLYRCAIAINGISNPGDYVEAADNAAPADDVSPLKADAAQDRGFRADANSPALIRRYFGAQPPAVISDAAVPVLLVHGDADRTVSPNQSRELRDRLQKTGKAAYVGLDGCGHELGTDTCRLQTAQAVVDFLKVNNPAR